jgi:hypothetical protein
MNMNDVIARQIIRERVADRASARRPTHPKTAQLLRRLASRAEGTT